MRESCDTCCKCTTYIGIDQCHLRCFIVVFVMHVLDQVQYVYIQSGEPVHHLVVFSHYFIIIKVFRSDRCVSRSYLIFWLAVDTTVDRVKKAFCKVCSCSEKLHFFTSLCCRYAAADRIVIAPYRTHCIIIFILDRTCFNRNMWSVVLEVLRKTFCVKYSQVRFRRRSHVFQGVQETVVCLCYHRTSVLSHSADFQCSPNRVTREELVVRWDTCELNHTEFHCHMVN